MTSSRVLPAATSVLAHKRLRDVTETLAHKVGGGTYDVGLGSGTRPVLVSDTERRVLGLARAALEQLGGGERVTIAPTSVLGPGPGRYAVLGTAAFDLPAYAGVITGDDHDWVTRVLRGGTADANRSHVVVGSTRLALRVGERAMAAGVDGAKARAFAHGMLDAVATNALASPVLHALHARRNLRDWRPNDPGPERRGSEHRALAMFGPRGARDWLGFWPGAHDVPIELYGAYLGALEDVHGFAVGRAPGFPSHDQAMASATLPSAQDLRAGYGLLRLDLAMSTWSWFDWWLFLLPMWVAPSVGLIVGRELPNAGRFFGTAPADEASTSELLTLATAFGSLPPFVWSMILWGMVPDHTGVFVESLLLFLGRVGLTIGWAASATGASDVGLRWGLLAPLLGADMYALVRGIIDAATGKPFDAFVHFLQTMPSVSGLFTLALSWLAEAFPVTTTEEFWGYWGVTTAVMLLLNFIPAAILGGNGLRGVLIGQGSGVRAADAVAGLGNPAIADPAAPALAFDDSTLWPDGEADQPTLAHLRYPSGTRPLVKIWWEGAGDLTIGHDDHTVVLNNGVDVPVEVPRAQQTAAGLAAALEAALPGVRTSVFDAAVPAPLPWPWALADPGDDMTNRDAHEVHKGDRKPVGTTADAAHVLRHSPRSNLGTRIGLAGQPVPLVPARGLADHDETAMGNAADLAVLLHLGAAPWLGGAVAAANPPPPAPALPAVGKVYEVFRQWNLDHRRVNEWRMLVGGGAETEKGANPARTDPGMLAGRPADSTAAVAGVPIADAMGWVPLWRTWLRVAGDLTADVDAAVTMSYTPTVRRADGSTFVPTNADLTAGVRYLLDLP